MRGGVVAVPFGLVLFAFEAVKAGMSGEDMMQEEIPVVTHPSADCPPEGTVLGIATKTIEGRATCTVHCAVPERP